MPGTLTLPAMQSIAAGIPMINGTVMRMTNNGMLLPYITDHIYCNYGKNYFTAFAELWMDKRYESATEIFHTEEFPVIYTVRVASAVTGSTGGGQVTVPYTSNTLNGFAGVQQGYFVGLPPLGKMAKVISVNPTAKTMVLEPNDKQYKIILNAGDDLVVAPAAVSAACACDVWPSSQKGPGLMFKSQMMIIKKFLRICGEDLAQWLADRWLFPLKSLTDPCTDIEVWWHADLDQMWFEFTYAKQIFMMLGEDITNDSANWTGLKSTTGVIHMLRARAQQEPVPASIGITIDYFKRVGKKLKRLRNYCNQYTVWSGYEHRSQIDTAFESAIVKQDVSWDFLNGDAQRGIRFGFDAAKIDNIEYYFHDEDSLNDPGFMGAAGWNGPNTTFMVPMCKLPCANKMSTAFIINYLSGNGVNRELIENDYGILRPGSLNSNCDYHEWMLMSQFGVDAYCLQNFIFTESI